MSEIQKKEFHAVVELMGHHQIAGFVTEDVIGGATFLRVDVPEVEGWPAHTKYYGPSAVYAIHPCSEEIALQAAERLARQWGYVPMPLAVPDLTAAQRVIAKARAAETTRAALPAGTVVENGWDDDEDLPL